MTLSVEEFIKAEMLREMEKKSAIELAVLLYGDGEGELPQEVIDDLRKRFGPDIEVRLPQ